MPAPLLTHPRTIDDLFLYRISRLLVTGGAQVIRLCEGTFGITRREWRILALLAQGDGLLSRARSLPWRPNSWCRATRARATGAR